MAQTAGIPALASDRGILAEAVGEAGLSIAADAPIDAWLAAFDALWDQPQVYARAVEAARRQSGAVRIDEIAAAVGALLGAAVADAPPASQVA